MNLHGVFLWITAPSSCSTPMDLDITPATAELPAHIHIGVSPAGVTWNVYPKDGESLEALAERVESQRARLADLKNKAGAKLSTLKQAYENARKNYLRWRGKVNSNAFRALPQGSKAHWRAQHEAASDRLLRARQALRKAEKSA